MPEITTTHHRQPPPPATTSPPRLSVRGQIGEILELQGGHIARRQSPATSPAPANFPATNFSSSTVKFAPKKEEKPSNNHHRPPASRLGTRGPIGEIVEVHGGHIVRSTGRKDRHSKVCTAKGPRDRRVRLSAHTAIQFYDVQDRLGYDRPSKAVDWLIKNAKSAIDELAKLPPWNPNTVNQNLRQPEAAEEETPIGITERFDEIEVEIENPNRVDFDFLLPSFDSVKSFFPTSAVSGSSTSFNFQNYSAATSGNEDLRLSLQAQTQAHQAHHQTGEELFPAVTTTVGFHGASVFQEDHDRIMPWNNTGGGTINNSDSNNNCHVINSLFSSSSVPPVTTLVALPMYGQSHQCYSSQRGPLQSSISSSNSNCNTSNVLVRAGIDVSTSDHENHYYQQHQFVPPMFNNQALMFGGGGGGGGFDPDFRIPARIQGGEEYGGGVSDNMPSSASSESLH